MCMFLCQVCVVKTSSCHSSPGPLVLKLRSVLDVLLGVYFVGVSCAAVGRLCLVLLPSRPCGAVPRLCEFFCVVKGVSWWNCLSWLFSCCLQPQSSSWRGRESRRACMGSHRQLPVPCKVCGLACLHSELA